VIPSTVLATSNSSSAGRAKATCLGSAALMCFDPGASAPVAGTAADRPTRRSSDWKRLSAEPEPKDRGCMIGVISNWPISREEQQRKSGPVDTGLLIRRHIADGASPSSPPGPRNIDRNAGRGRRTSMGDRGQLRGRQERTRARSQREQVMAWLASSRVSGDARLRHDGGDPPSR
jgi:hypothetical protein